MITITQNKNNEILMATDKEEDKGPIFVAQQQMAKIKKDDPASKTISGMRELVKLGVSFTYLKE